MRKNKTAAAILALAITTSLAGCGNHAPTTTDKDTSSPSTVASEVAEGTTTPGENSSSVEASAPSTSAPEPSSASEPESTASKPAETTPESSATASQPAAPSKPEQTKPVETKPADKPAENKPTENTPAKPVEKPEETKPSEKPTEPKPEETSTSKPEEMPPVQPVQIADSKEVEAKVAQYINQYRNTNAVVLPGLTQVARYRSKQLVTHFAHDTTDEREALDYYQYGEIVDVTEFGLPASDNYRRGYNAEAIAKGNWRGTADEIGREIAKGFRNSEGHWSYLGSDEYGYTAVGCTYDPASGLWYCCICVSKKDYGG